MNTSNLPGLSWPEILFGEQLVFSLLGRALRTCDDGYWLQSLASENIFRDIPFSGNQPDTLTGQAALVAWSLDQASSLTHTTFDALRADFTGLFVGPGPLYMPPWESVYFNDDRLTFEQQTVQVRSWYRRYGLEAEEIYREPDDHIGLELLFLGHLAGLALAAHRKKDLQTFEDLLCAQQKFLEEHLLRWAPQWCDGVAEKARTLFYRGLVLVVKGALMEAKSLKMET